MHHNFEPKEYLAIRLGVLGDVLLTTGVLDYWHARQDQTFHMVTRSALAPIFEHHPAVSKIIAVQDHNLHGFAWISFCHSLRRDYGQLPLLDLHKNLRTLYLRLVWPGPSFCYAKQTLARRLFLATHHDFFSRHLKKTNVPQRYSLALESHPPDPSLLRPKIFLAPEELQDAAQTLHSLGLTRPVAIHPYATHSAKSPDPKTWQQVIQLLKAQGQEVIIIGHNPKPLFPDLAQDLTNSTSLRQTAALLHLCHCLISGDSGPMHLATAVSTPVIALFGPTTQEWGFFPSGPRDIIYQVPCPKAPCSLHGQKTCSQPQICMQQIPPKDIVNLVNSISD